MPTTYSPFYLVEEFHLTYNHPVRVHPNLNIPQRQLRIDLINEEVDELVEAWENKDFVEVIDALADIVYVACGASLTHGLNSQTILGLNKTNTPQENNSLPINGFPAFSNTVLEEQVPVIKTLAEIYQNAANDNAIFLATSTIARLVKECYITAANLGVNLDIVLKEVQASNMSKLGADGKPILREDGKILKGPNFFTPNILNTLRAQGYEN